MKFVRKCVISFAGNPLTAPGNSGVRPEQPCAVSFHPGGRRAARWRFPCLTDTDVVILEIPQVVWKASTQVGCAETACSGIFAASFGLAKYFVCEYSPQGNVIGEFAYVPSTPVDDDERILLILPAAKTCRSEYAMFSRFRIVACLYFCAFLPRLVFCDGVLSSFLFALYYLPAYPKRCCHYPRDVCVRARTDPTGSTRSSQSPPRAAGRRR